MGLTLRWLEESGVGRAPPDKGRDLWAPLGFSFAMGALAEQT